MAVEICTRARVDNAGKKRLLVRHRYVTNYEPGIYTGSLGCGRVW